MRTLSLTLCISAVASADTTLWDEGVSGDLGNDPTLTPLVLVAGVNHVVGSVHLVSDPFDTWEWTLPGSLEVVATKVTISGFSGGHGAVRSSDSADFNSGYVISFTGDGEQTWSDLLLRFAMASAQQTGSPVFPFDDGDSASFSYDFAVTTRSLTQPSGPDPVPEPATLALLGSGLAFALAARRRKRSA